MLVNQLAKRGNIASHVVRYYTKIGLLKPKKDIANGYKQFDGDDVERPDATPPIRKVQSQ